jgi:CheY-like chemotaxis protein
LPELQRLKPDVIISDIGMAGENGYDLIRKIRSLEPEQGGRIPAIALTAYAAMSDRRRALLAGFQTHLAKPINAEDLVAVVLSLTFQQMSSLHERRR